MTPRRTRTNHRIASCHRHPTARPTTGFCAACLRERLARIEANSDPSEARLRRTRSYSSRANPNSAAPEEPRRRSCEVRSQHGTFDDLFEGDEERGVESEREEIVDGDFEEGGESKTMKEFMDLEVEKQDKKNVTVGDLSGIASVFGKKLMKWKQKQTNKKKNEHLELRSVATEIRESGLRRPSRVSFDEPRASWDGCLTGNGCPKLKPLASVSEDSKVASGSDDAEDKNPGGSAQTREYYSDSRRRRSFDRSSSIKRGGSVEVDEAKAVSNMKVSPETIGLFHGAKLLVTEKELRGSDWYSIKPGRVGCASKDVGSVPGDVNPQGFSLKTPPRQPRNVWNIWGLMKRGGKTKNGSSDKKNQKLEGSLIEGSLAESLLKLKRVAGGAASEKLIRSYSISARNSCDGAPHSVDSGANPWNGPFHLMNGVDGGRRSCDRFVHHTNGVKGGRKSCDGVFHCTNDVGETNSVKGLYHHVNCINDVRIPREGLVHVVHGVERGRKSCEGLSNCRNVVEGGRRSCDGLFCGLNSLESGRKSCDGLIYSVNGAGAKANGMYVKESHLLQRSQNAGQSPNNNLDNSLLRFYLTPLRSYKRSKSGKSRLRNSSSMLGSAML